MDREERLTGVIIERLHQGNEYLVQLDNGAEIRATLPMATLRKQGCLFGALNGYAVSLNPAKGNKPAKIIQLLPPNKDL